MEKKLYRLHVKGAEMRYKISNLLKVRKNMSKSEKKSVLI